MIKRYAPSAEPVEAILLNDSNLEEAAKWCGGEVKQLSNPESLDEAWDRAVLVPGIPSAFTAKIGWYLVKGRDNKFRIWLKEHFEREYHEVGKRQDGFTPRGEAIRRDNLPAPSPEVESHSGYMQRLGW